MKTIDDLKFEVELEDGNFEVIELQDLQNLVFSFIRDTELLNQEFKYSWKEIRKLLIQKFNMEDWYNE